ncbi:MAG: nitrilase-related carbon-nitrogen hydrolase [Verrucomicrobiales bacterium]
MTEPATPVQAPPSKLLAWSLVVLAPLPGTLAFAPYYVWWVMPLMSWMLLVGIREMSPRTAFLAGLVNGTLLFAVTMSWLWNLFDVLSIVLWMILGGFTGIFSYFYRVGSLQFQNALGTSVFAALLWTGVEHFRSEVFVLKFPWITPGVALPPGWLSPLIGTYGVTFLVILAAALLTHRRCRWLGGSVLILLYASVLIPRSVPASDGTPVRVIAVQNEGGAFKHHLDQSASVPGNVDLVIWPEHSVPYALMDQERQLGELRAFLNQRNAIAVIGTRRMEPTREAPDGSSAWFNMACAISADAILGYHDKNHPVHFFNDGIAGTTAGTVDTPFGKMGMPVCFDVDFQDVVRRMTLAGARIDRSTDYGFRILVGETACATRPTLPPPRCGKWTLDRCRGNIRCDPDYRLTGPHARAAAPHAQRRSG